MMEEEEETLFDQEGLLNQSDQQSNERKEWKYKLMKTIALSMAFFCLGLCIAIPGPTLMDLGQRVDRDVEHMTFIFTARSFGYLIGSLVGGVLFDFFDQQILLFYTLAATAVATAGVPWCTALIALSTLICMQGVAIGVLDTGGNVFCIRIWGKKSAPYMQVLHFAFGIGAFLAPLIARPFLNDSVILYSSNTSKGDVHPVNFELPGMRFDRDLSRVEYLENPFGNHRESKRDTHHIDQAPLNFLDTGLDAPLFKYVRIEREAALENGTEDGSTLDLFSNHTESLGNLTLGNSTVLAVTTSSTTSTKRPAKPSYLGSAGLSEKHADSSINQSKLKERVKNRDSVVDDKKVTTAVDFTQTDGFNATSQNDSAVAGNITVDSSSNDTQTANMSEAQKTGLPSSDGSSSTVILSTQKTTTAPPTTVPTTATTTTTTTPPTTTPTTTTTTVKSTTSTSTTTATKSPTSTAKVTPITKTLIPDTQEPFKPVETVDVTLNSSNMSNSNITKPDTMGSLLSAMLDTLANMSKIQFSYLVIGLLLTINAGLFLFLYCKDRLNKAVLYRVTHEDLTRPPDSKCFVASILILLFFFFLVYVGMEVTFGGLITTFAVDYRQIIWTPAQGAMLAALFWGAIAIGRGFAIFIARCFKPPCMMVTNITLTVIGASLLSFGVQKSPTFLWAGTVMIGLGLSSIFPTAISWADSYHPLTGKLTAVFVAGSGFGEMTIPVLTGYLYSKVDRMSLMYMTLTLSCLLAVLFLALQVIACKKGTVNPRRSHSGFMRLENSEEMADALDMDLVEVSDRTSLGLSDNNRRMVKPENGRKENGGADYEVTEFTKLVELSD